MKPYSALLFVAAIFINLTAFGQAGINTESFKYIFKRTQNGARASYVGKSHSFTFDVKGTNVKEQLVNGADENMHFIDVDKNLFQSSIVEMPQPIPASYNLANLTVAQQKQAIEGYVDYELDYFNQIGVKPLKLKKDWIYINSRLFMMWEFDVKFAQPGTSPADQVKGQVYLATACFNQMLVFNIPLMDRKEQKKPENKLKSIAATLRLYNKSLAVK